MSGAQSGGRTPLAIPCSPWEGGQRKEKPGGIRQVPSSGVPQENTVRMLHSHVTDGWMCGTVWCLPVPIGSDCSQCTGWPALCAGKVSREVFERGTTREREK